MSAEDIGILVAFEVWKALKFLIVFYLETSLSRTAGYDLIKRNVRIICEYLREFNGLRL